METAALYVHIPFCLSKCTYCDFFSLPVNSVPNGYVERLIEEHEYRKKNYLWSSVYIGGGTPSLLRHPDIVQFFNIVKPNCTSDAEITFECNPGDVTEELLKTLADCGVNRLSLGIQTFSDEKLAFCKRRSTGSINHSALELIKKAHFPHFSVDLISGLPPAADDAESLCSGILSVMDYGADHISLYSLTVEEGTPLYNQVQLNPSLLDEEHNDNVWISGRDFLNNNGFHQYEVSNFAREGCQSRHNKTYWDMKTYEGLGAGAVGTEFSGNTAQRYTNSTSIDCYINRPFQEQEERFMLGPDDCINEFCMMGFRKIEGVNGMEFKKRFGFDISRKIEPVFSRWINDNRAHITANGNYALTESGLLFLNSFLIELFSITL